MSANPAPKQANIRVSLVTHQKLTQKKNDDGHASYDSVILTLLSDALNDQEDEEEEEEALEAASPEPKKRKKNVREALITVDLVKQREGMMRDYTGLTIPQFEMLCARMKEEVSHFVF